MPPARIACVAAQRHHRLPANLHPTLLRAAVTGKLRAIRFRPAARATVRVPLRRALASLLDGSRFVMTSS
jgi:hypothetical protein